ncbi:vitamin B12 transporter [Cnuella takakiae]|uniref:Vitamin B12 transporter n=1 Tax=Cnuella takakiae TaxID=1302690 RepID=A0A1M5E3Q4_9BACT|nr:TonB-dependent receptor [Cnuella takakiae]OLY93788.1 hypothetical protein BUE76_19280 [Cnuella takakiae]SHF73826.1 vitamin B12 transporter [Cnuella takakiae]
MKKHLFLVTAVAFGSIAQAQRDTTALDEVVVTANRFAQKQSNTGKVVSVITTQQLQRSGGKDLAQLLSEQAGITLNSANANPGKDKSLFLQGASSNYTLILLDGVAVNDPSATGGTFDLRLLPIDQIERIEILKGSQSTLYGSNAIAGVLNIITKKATSTTPTINGLLAYGSYNTFRGNANVSRKGKVLDYSVNYERYSTDGISEALDTTGKAGFDKDGFQRNALQANLGINITDKIKLSPFYRYTEYKGNYDADAFTDGANRYDARLQNVGLNGTATYGTGTLHVNFGHNYVLRNYNGLPFRGTFNQAEAYVNQTLNSKLQLLAGVNFQTYRMPSIDTVNNLFSLYSSLYFKPGKKFNAELGGRYNHHNQYGDNFTYSINPSILLTSQVKLFANLSTGFRAPGISELFGPFGANATLKPETSQSFQGGVQTWLADGKLSVRANYFDRTIKNVIIYDWRQGYQNRDKQHDKGAELELQYQPNQQWNFRANYTFVDGAITQKLQTKDTSFYNLLRRPKNTFNLFAGYQVSKAFFVSASLQYLGKRDDVFFNPANFWTAENKSLEAYALVHAYAEYQLVNQRLRIFADVRNLANKKDYSEVYGYSVQGRNAQLGIRFTL